MLLNRISDPYSSLESFVYDRFIAPGVTALSWVLEDELEAALPRGGTLLDVGSGGGQNAMYAAKLRPDARITGLDLSRDQVRRARKRVAAAGLAIEFTQGSALDLPFEDDSFDAVMSIASIKHWPDQRRGVSECVRVLTPAGHLLIAEADRGCRLEDVHAFVRELPMPVPMRWAMVPVFRTWVAGQALDLEDARALLHDLPLAESEVRRIDGLPALMLRGIKAR